MLCPLGCLLSLLEVDASSHRRGPSLDVTAWLQFSSALLSASLPVMRASCMSDPTPRLRLNHSRCKNRSHFRLTYQRDLSPRPLASMFTRVFLLAAAIPGLVPGDPTVRASGRPPGNEVPTTGRTARPVPGFTTACAQQSGLRGLVFFGNPGCLFPDCHSHGFGLLGRYNYVGKRFSHSFLSPVGAI